MDFKPPDNAGTNNGPPYHEFARPHRFPQVRNVGSSNNSPLMRENNNSRVSVQDRLGNSTSGGNGNRGDNFRGRGGGNRHFQNHNYNNGPNQPTWRYNNKRTLDEDRDCQMNNAKRWKQNNNKNQKKPYQRTSQNSAQHRLNKIKRRFNDEDPSETPSFKDDMSSACTSDISEVPGESLTFHVENEQVEEEAPDITVEVVNNNPVIEEPPLEEPATKFKMVLTPKLQNSIKMIQEKRKEKQVIIPYPVKPNITAMSTHERFSLL